MSEVFKQLGVVVGAEAAEEVETEKESPNPGWTTEKRRRQAFLSSLACPKRE